MSRRILVADDSSTIQNVIKIAFARYPVEMLEAASLVEALSLVARTPPVALILDASLPGTQGPQDFVKLAKDARGVPVLLLVGTYEAIDEAQFRAAGFHHFLRKPFDSIDLVSEVDAMLAGVLTQAGASGATIPPGSTQRPAHATVIQPGGLAEIERQSRAAAMPPPPPPQAGVAAKGKPPADFVPPPPPAGRRGAGSARVGHSATSPVAPNASGARQAPFVEMPKDANATDLGQAAAGRFTAPAD